MKISPDTYQYFDTVAPDIIREFLESPAAVKVRALAPDITLDRQIEIRMILIREGLLEIGCDTDPALGPTPARIRVPANVVAAFDRRTVH